MITNQNTDNNISKNTNGTPNIENNNSIHTVNSPFEKGVEYRSGENQQQETIEYYLSCLPRQINYRNKNGFSYLKLNPKPAVNVLYSLNV